MAFIQAELDSIANAALDYYFNKGKEFQQSIQKKPMLDMFLANAKTFPGGKGDISLAVKGDYGAAGVNDTLKGYTHNDTVVFYTPANIKRAHFPWREHHLGLTLTHTELKIDGISVTDPGGNGSSTSNHSSREETVLVGLMEDKTQDLGEQYARSLDKLFHGDGTTDAKALAGIMALIADAPQTGTVGGLSRATYSWWRNRARTAASLAAGGLGAVTSDPANGGALLQALADEYRQLIRYSGTPNTFFAGSDFMSALTKEVRANGLYNMSGMSGTQNVSVGGIVLDGGVRPVYDPTLDDTGHSKRGIWMDNNAIFLMKMESEWQKTYTPARPPAQFVLYKSITCTGQLVATRLNSSLIIDIA